jgi:AbrB family looped-hinge helix DNA binding protein
MAELASIRLLTYYIVVDTLDWVAPMDTVRVSPKFQVVIPKHVREQLNLRPGEELQVYVLDAAIHLHRPRSIQDLRGIAKGMKWKDAYRDRFDRF